MPCLLWFRIPCPATRPTTNGHRPTPYGAGARAAHQISVSIFVTQPPRLVDVSVNGRGTGHPVRHNPRKIEFPCSQVDIRTFSSLLIQVGGDFRLARAAAKRACPRRAQSKNAPQSGGVEGISM